MSNSLFSPSRLGSVVGLFDEVRRRSIGLGIASIDPVDGVVLYSIAFTIASNRSSVLVLDLGAGIGYSTLWIAAGVEDGCRSGSCSVVAVERVASRAKEIEYHVGRLGLRKTRVNVWVGDALVFLKGLDKGVVDLAFVDVDKALYKDVLELLEDKLKRDGIVVFHNAYFPTPPSEFFKALEGGPWITGFTPTSVGMIIARPA